jgi:hypothetical protein
LARYILLHRKGPFAQLPQYLSQCRRDLWGLFGHLRLLSPLHQWGLSDQSSLLLQMVLLLQCSWQIQGGRWGLWHQYGQLHLYLMQHRQGQLDPLHLSYLSILLSPSHQ